MGLNSTDGIFLVASELSRGCGLVFAPEVGGFIFYQDHIFSIEREERSGIFFL